MSAGRTQRVRALMFGCPKCGASVGFACRRENGTLRTSFHRTRSARRAPVELKIAAETFAGSKRGQTVLFFASDEWRRVRYEALRRSDGVCQCCGSRAAKGAPLHVDHIKPRSKFPDLALDLSNLQVLCRDCNLGKSNRDQTDWRRK